jgi:hypothetical protein
MMADTTMKAIRQLCFDSIENKLVELFDGQQPGDRWTDSWRKNLITAQDNLRPKGRKKSGARRKGGKTR